MSRLSFDCEELLHWWEPKSDVSFIFNFNWHNLQQMREAITIFMASRLHAVAKRAERAIAETGCPRLRMMLATNPQSPADMLEFLSGLSSTAVLIRIAENTNTGRETLSRLAFHEDAEVRAAVAENQNTPESCMKRLVFDESVDVRFSIAENPHSPASSLYTLLKDDNPFVSHRARQTLSRILSNTITESTRMLMAEETEMRQDLVKKDLSALFNKQLLEELNDLCGGEIVTVDFPVHDSTRKHSAIS